MKLVKNPWSAALAFTAAAATIVSLGGCANKKLAAQRNALLEQNKAMESQLADASQQGPSDQPMPPAQTYVPPPPACCAGPGPAPRRRAAKRYQPVSADQ